MNSPETKASESWHVYPLNDLRPHETEGKLCWCGPKREDNLVIHNSMDQREKYETGERKPS